MRGYILSQYPIDSSRFDFFTRLDTVLLSRTGTLISVSTEDGETGRREAVLFGNTSPESKANKGRAARFPSDCSHHQRRRTVLKKPCQQRLHFELN